MCSIKQLFVGIFFPTSHPNQTSPGSVQGDVTLWPSCANWAVQTVPPLNPWGKSGELSTARVLISDEQLTVLSETERHCVGKWAERRGLSQRNETCTVKNRDWDSFSFYLTALYPNTLRATWRLEEGRHGDGRNGSRMSERPNRLGLRTWQWRTGFTITIDSAPD